MGIELYVYNLLVVRSSYGDSGGESDLNWGVHSGDHGAYVWESAIEMTKLASCEYVSFRRCETMYEPSGVGMSEGGAFAFFDVK